VETEVKKGKTKKIMKIDRLEENWKKNGKGDEERRREQVVKSK
jgi:hypothetical protein